MGVFELGGGNVKGIDIATGAPVSLYAVESIDYPGKYGLIVLNPDGTMLSAGSAPVETYYFTLEDGTSDFLLENGADKLRKEG